MTSPLSPQSDLTTVIDAWQSAHDDLVELVESLDEQQWREPTDLPGWSIADIVGHIVWIEMLLMGETDPEHEPDWASLPHVTTDFGRRTEIPVDLRRSWTRDQVMEQCRDVLSRRLEALRSGPQDRETVCDGVFGPTTIGALVQQRAFDTWVHEQDIRRAIGRPGHIDTLGAQATATQLMPGWGKIVAKGAKAQPGESVRLKVTEPGVSFDITVTVNSDGKATIGASGPDATTTLTMPWEAYVLAVCGRAGDWRSQVSIDGDADLAERVLANITLTP